jgi:hypothetical protein
MKIDSKQKTMTREEAFSADSVPKDGQGTENSLTNSNGTLISGTLISVWLSPVRGNSGAELPQDSPHPQPGDRGRIS